MISTTKRSQYVIGGAVRDIMLGKHPKDIDYLWVGTTPQYLIELNMQQVGAGFPVFLDVEGNEHALARVERKNGAGYTGFVCDYNEDITLKDDQSRRDLTINQLAVKIEDWENFLKTKDNSLIIDSFNGLTDLENGIIRHTSEAFADDPLRVLRAARFAARYNFTIDFETQKLMSIVANSGELSELPVERVFAEFRKAIMEDHPIRFFEELPRLTYDLFFNELSDYHNTGLSFGVTINSSFEERLMLLCMNMKPMEAGAMLTRLKAPTATVNQVMMSCHLSRMVWDSDNLHDLWQSFERANAFKHIPMLQKAVNIQLYWGSEFVFKRVRFIMMILHLGSKVNFNSLSDEQQQALQGKEIGDAISEERQRIMSQLFRDDKYINEN